MRAGIVFLAIALIVLGGLAILGICDAPPEIQRGWMMHAAFAVSLVAMLFGFLLMVVAGDDTHWRRRRRRK